MSNNDLDAYKAKHELIAIKKALTNKVLTNTQVKSNPQLVEKIKQISLELEECMTAINTVLYSQAKTVNSSSIALDQFNTHYWRLRPAGTTHAIFHPSENIVYWAKGKTDAHHLKDIQSIWSLSNWSSQHHLLKNEATDINIVKFPKIEKIAIRFNGIVYPLALPNDYASIYDSLYKQGLAPTPFDSDQGFIHPTTGEFIDAKEASIYAKYIGMLPEDSDVADLTPAMVA